MTEMTSPSGQEQSVSLQKDCTLFCVILVENTIASPSGTGKHPDFPAKRNQDTTGNKTPRSQEQDEPAMKVSAFKARAHLGCECLLITETESSSWKQMSHRIPQGILYDVSRKKESPGWPSARTKRPKRVSAKTQTNGSCQQETDPHGYQIPGTAAILPAKVETQLPVTSETTVPYQVQVSWKRNPEWFLRSVANS